MNTNPKFCDLKTLSLEKATGKAKVLREEFHFKIQKVYSLLKMSVKVGKIREGYVLKISISLGTFF